MDISLGKLLHLVVAARCGTISAAARELNMSQPALSRSIAAIEQSYGFQIFNRVGHGVELTAAGRQAIEQAEPSLRALRILDDNLQLLGSGKTGTLSFGMPPLLASELLAGFTKDFLVPGYDVQLRVLIRPGHDLTRALRNDEIEFCMFPESQGADLEGLSVELAGHVMPTCVVRSDHPLAKQAEVNLDDLAPYPWASSVEPPYGPEVPSRSRMVCDNYHVLREAVATTDLVCICTEGFVAPQIANRTLRSIEVAGLNLRSTDVFLAKLPGRILSPLAERAIGRLRACLV